MERKTLPIRATRLNTQERIPELKSLSEKCVSLFGVGAIGAPICLELARAGVDEIRIMDHDFLDPGTVARWPLGLCQAGAPKVKALEEFVHANYPMTTIKPYQHSLGSPRRDEINEHEYVEKFIEGASLVIDATAETGVQIFTSQLCKELGIPYISTEATNGAWGGVICRIRPGVTHGCWHCYRAALYTDGAPFKINTPPFNDTGEVQPAGCADPTFTGSGFDLNFVSMMTVRLAASTMLGGTDGGYPETDDDVIIIKLREDDGRFCVPEFKGYPLKRQETCKSCSPAK